jgi:lipopolysaccharide biosynthesis regulator YciM
MEFALLFLLLPVAALSGWLGAKLSARRSNQDGGDKLSSQYLAGLNFLLNEQPDKAVELFIKMIEVDSETVETHLALGSLFRRRGEVDRAIRIHQNLIARPNLSQRHRMQSLYELSLDYMRAGVLDRAESLFLELVSLNSHMAESLRHLIDIYERERDWNKAIEVAQKYQLIARLPMQSTIAHYHCELAEQSLRHNQVDRAQRYIKRAMAIDPRNVRGQILQGQHMIAQGQYKAAIRCFLRVKNRMPEFTAEIVALLGHCYEATQQLAQFKIFLQQCFQESLGIQVLTALPERFYSVLEDTITYPDIMRRLRDRPSMRGLFTILSIRVKRVQGDMHDDIAYLMQVLQPLLNKETPYTCDHCGYSVSTLYWHCPSCRHWGTMKPYSGLKISKAAA